MNEIKNVSGVPTLNILSTEDLNQFDLIIDVRRPEEYTGELAHIKGSKLVTLGEELTKYLDTISKEKKILFVCRSGMRSGTATKEALEKGFTSPVNMAGGMILWNENKFDVEK